MEKTLRPSENIFEIYCTSQSSNNVDTYIHDVIQQINGPVIVNCLSDRLIVFSDQDVTPLKLLTQSGKGRNPTRWLYKDGDSCGFIHTPYLIYISHSFKDAYEKANGNVPIVFYDALAKKFQPYGSKLCFSKSIRVIDPVVSFKQNLNNTPDKQKTGKDYWYQYNYAKSYCGYSIKSRLFQEPIHVCPVYQCTDGPMENAVYCITPSIQQTFSPTRPRIRARHPDFDDQETRYKTFARWPLQADVQDVSKLAEYGFFYTGQCDLVRCYQCGIGFKDWSRADDQVWDHVNYSPNCAHLVEIIEPQRLQQYRNLTQFGKTVKLNAAGTIPSGQQIPLRHPHFKSCDARRRTYEKWPTARVQTPDELTDAGFFYTGFQDKVLCYSCDGGLQHWGTDDDPWIEHARWFPHCWHVKQVKGQNFVSMVQLALTETDHEDLSADSLADMTINGASSERESDLIYSRAAQNVMTLGFSKAAVQMAIQECTDKGRRWNQEILRNVLLEKQNRGEVLPTDSPRPESPVQPEVYVLTPNGPLVENKRLRRRLLCTACNDNIVDVLFLPCAHLKMCMNCAANAVICPVCKKEIKEKVKTYMVGK